MMNLNSFHPPLPPAPHPFPTEAILPNKTGSCLRVYLVCVAH